MRRRGPVDSSSEEDLPTAPVARIGESSSVGVGLLECSSADILATRPPPRTDMPARSLSSPGPSVYPDGGGICFIVAGWLKTLVAGLLERLLRSSRQPRMISASSARAPNTAPITMPAICPPVRPRCATAAADVGSLVALLPSPVVRVVTICDNDDDAITGSATFSHRCSVSENTQHESVEFGELDEQYEHRDPRFELNPQSSGWFATPDIHCPLNEFAGRAQLVKSARICVRASEFEFPHTLLAVISCSLCAYSAHESAQRGRVASLSSPQGSAEFCIMALQSTLVVYRA
jgi:hypothetical protein